jgi:hypothetical protein
MKRTKTIKLSVLALVVGLIFMGFIFSVSAANRRSTVKYRPLSHYTKNNPCVFYSWFGPSPSYHLRLDLSDWFSGGFEPGEGNPPPKGTYDGYIEERELPDGRAEISIYLQLHDAPFWVWSPPFEDNELVMEGMIDWYYGVERFIINRPGAEIPNILTVPDYLVIAGSGTGYGTFTESAVALGFESGEEGKLYVFQYGDMQTGEWLYEILDLYQL